MTTIDYAQTAASKWQTSFPPKDGRKILAIYSGDIFVIYWDEWQTGGETLSDGTAYPYDGTESGWMINGSLDWFSDDPDYWSHIYSPQATNKTVSRD